MVFIKEYNMDYVNKWALSVFCTIIVVVVFTSSMTFIEVDPQSYNPFMYFMILLLVFYLVLT